MRVDTLGKREWTFEQNKTFKAMRLEKKSYREIANAIGKSRAAVSGRARRMIEVGMIERIAPKPKTKSDPVPVPILEPPTDTAVSMMELSDRMCKWTVSDAPRMFCGAKAFKGSWCEYHAGKVWVPGSLTRKSETQESR